MLGRRRAEPPGPVARSVYGVGLVIDATDRQLLDRMLECLPPSRAEIDTAEDLPRFRLDTSESPRLTLDDQELATGDLHEMLEQFEIHSRNLIAFSAPDHVFVHAGVVSYNNAAIVLPGESFSGKTTLVAQLTRAGAIYYSDEYAVIDSAGLVHPYPKPLALRLTDGDPLQTPHDVSELGGTAGTEPVPIGMVVATQYRPGAEWRPEAMSKSEALVTMIGHTYLAVDRPEMTMATLRAALGNASGLQGDRGEAATVAADLLARSTD